jgi:hypothetical protein
MMPIWLIGAALATHGTRWEPRGTQAIALTLCGLILLSLSRLWAFDVQTAMACALIAQFTEYRSRDVRHWLAGHIFSASAKPCAAA